MKKRLLRLFLFSICGTFGACIGDPVNTTNYYVVNSNDKDAVVEAFGVIESDPDLGSQWNVSTGDTCYVGRWSEEGAYFNPRAVLGDSVRISFSDSTSVMFYCRGGSGSNRMNAENDIYKSTNWTMGEWDERVCDAYYTIR